MQDISGEVEEEEDAEEELRAFVFSESVGSAKSLLKHSTSRAEEEEEEEKGSPRRWFSADKRSAICRTTALTQFALDSFSTETIWQMACRTSPTTEDRLGSARAWNRSCSGLCALAGVPNMNVETHEHERLTRRPSRRRRSRRIPAFIDIFSCVILVFFFPELPPPPPPESRQSGWRSAMAAMRRHMLATSASRALAPSSTL